MRIITDKELRLEALKCITVTYPTYVMIEDAENIYRWLKTGEVEEVESKEGKEDHK